MTRRKHNNDERGATMLEMAIAGSVFFLAAFGLIEFGRLLWTHNALTDAARQGARYAALNSANASKVKNVVVYGDPNPPAGAKPVVYGLTTTNVEVNYSGFAVKQGRVEVKINNYQYTFSVPLIGASMTMGSYHTTLTAESAGYVPPNI
jgi:Flp pilus assembly protein TadG